MSLKTIIDAQGRKQSWVAAQLGIPNATFHNMAHGRSSFPAERVADLARLLGVPAAEVLTAIKEERP